MAIKKPIVVRSIAPLRKAVAGLRGKHRKVALVPTMGALHDGHFALIKQARRRADVVVVSIFVNPAQFAPTEDLASYPRDIQRDLAALTDLGVDLVWAPTEKVMYPDGFSTAVTPGGPAKAGLEDTFRPHFFGGVTTVVSKLFLQVAPNIALFGQKDYQQLKVVTRMAKDLDIPVTIVGVPTMRDKDGLAMSSRNVYLSVEERTVAPTLHRVLKDSAAKIRAGKPIADVMATGRTTIERAGFKVDYLEARHADSLAPIAPAADGPIRLLVAAKLGKTRLIDNLGV
ncbi:pantoate--beta-alanine ligase [Pseudorhodoplanes sinuspersici]|uniref:Pantothenate synthetase n=1 Tax=Pseudorhodoplanes sinuspersici TaxID=1235591 RepID=A0A1W6ZVJ2_9HYPH|nr:pantoate--beta-alanine ligase [Pseudorhodoplanes sinuspersici]ARQ01459.1 pantoate--beta-alanine ligase [Pseudorhodoplanes sinuspersici]RKE73151.1 pantothenate synthetase [Pseudorhodoplanes sinuspersici]